MTALPRHLSPWATELALFPPDIALSLGETIVRLSLLVGNWRRAPHAEGEPDGYDGIARRGSYERLLPVEWSLLDEVPEEFLRRVVSGEHTFLRRAHTTGAAHKRCVALFDAGIAQLGAPRLAHLALLIVLARRAVEQGARLEWGVLQGHEGSLHSGVTPANVLELLRARVRRSVTAADAARWAGHLDGAAASERWVIGAQSLTQMATRLGASLVTAEDVIERGTPQRIVVRARTSKTDPIREVILDVPEPSLAVRLLRDPFATAVAPRIVTSAHVDVRSEMFFSADGRRLYARRDASSLITFHVPNSPRATVGPPVAFSVPADQLIIGIGSSQKRPLVLAQRGRELFVHRLSKRGASSVSNQRFVLEDDPALPTPSPTTLNPLTALSDRRFCYVNHAGQLVELLDGKAARRTTYTALASGPSPMGLIWVAHQPHGDRITLRPQVVFATKKGTDLEVVAISMPTGLPEIHDRATVRFAGGVHGLFAYAASPTSWVAVQGHQWAQIRVSEDVRIMGAVKLTAGTLALVGLDASAMNVDLLLPDQQERLLTTTAPVTNASVSGNNQDLALLTSDGEVVIYSCHARTVIMRSKGFERS